MLTIHSIDYCGCKGALRADFDLLAGGITWVDSRAAEARANLRFAERRRHPSLDRMDREVLDMMMKKGPGAVTFTDDPQPGIVTRFLRWLGLA